MTDQLLRNALRNFLEFFDVKILPGEAGWDVMTGGRAALDAGHYDLELCVCRLCDHLDDFEDLDRMSDEGGFTEYEQATIYETLCRDPSSNEMAAIRSMIAARYFKFLGRG